MNEHTDASLGLEDIDVVVVDEPFEVKPDPRDNVSLELSLLVNSGAPEVDPNVKIESQFLFEESHMMDIDEVFGWKDESHETDIPFVDHASLSDVENNRVSLYQLRYIHAPESVDSFEPGKLVDYVRLLATGSFGESDEMELTLVKSQLMSYGRFKGYRQLAEFQLFGQLLDGEQVIKGHPKAALKTSRKRKTLNENGRDVFEFDDVKDSYWTDRIIQNLPEEQGQGKEKPSVKPARRSNKKRFFNADHEILENEQLEIMKRRKQNLATEVSMRFGDGVCFPSEIHLNKMFKRFGPLMESETEVDRQSGRARVVFKKCSDAEVAHDSARTCNIFGSVRVDYEINYAPLISYKPLPLSLVQGSPLAW